MREKSQPGLTVRVAPCRATALFYHGLAHLELGDDAASLHDPVYLGSDGSAALGEAAPRLAALYLRIAAPMGLHAPPLLLEAGCGEESLFAALRGAGPSAEARAFGEAMAAALAAEAPAFAARWSRFEAGLGSGLSHLAARLAAELEELLSGLEAARTIEVRPVPALRDAGRATLSAEKAIVATDLTLAVPTPAPRLLFQVLHEVSHALVDDLVSRPGALRSTDPRSPGYAAQLRCEQAVLALDHHLVRRHRPRLTPAYLGWCARWVIPSSDPRELARLRSLAGVGAAEWRALARVAAEDRERAAEAALEELLLIEEPARAAILGLLYDAASRPRPEAEAGWRSRDRPR